MSQSFSAFTQQELLGASAALDATEQFGILVDWTSGKGHPAQSIQGPGSCLAEERDAKRTMGRKLSALRSYYRYLARMGKSAANPFALVSSPRRGHRLPQFLHLDEVRDLIASIDTSDELGTRDRAIIELLYSSGIRLSELTSLLVNVDLNAVCASVRKESKEDSAEGEAVCARTTSRMRGRRWIDR